MPKGIDQTDYQWACEQIDKHRQLYPRYEIYAETLKQVLNAAVKTRAPMAVVETRPKTIASFAEKIQRKKDKYRDPVNQLTDLCGGRVITHTYAEVETVTQFIEERFLIDEVNSVKIHERLKPAEFGYRSIHYVVQFKADAFPNDEIHVEIPEELYPGPGGIPPMKAEIQVRTLLEHAWASFSHERVYKGDFSVPETWQRELAGLAAMLEEADRAFSRIQAGLRTYAATYGAYMSEEKMLEEIELQRLVLSCDPDNPKLAARVGKLAIALEQWATAVEVLSPHVDSGYQPILRDLGMALCKLNGDRPYSPEFVQGQEYLKMACASPQRDVDALASLAGTYKTRNAPGDQEIVRDHYRQAFEVDPTDPYAVGNFLVAEIAHRQDTSPVVLLTPAIRAAMERCRDQALVGMNIPWAYYDLGKFHLLLGNPHESLLAHAKAIQVSTGAWMIDTSLRTLNTLGVIAGQIPGLQRVCRALMLGRAARFPDSAALGAVAEHAAKGRDPVKGPVVIVAGGTDARIENEMQAYRRLLLDAFQGFQGTIVSGGTRAGVVGLVGEVQAAYHEAIHTIGYIPSAIPAHVALDDRYHDHRSTEGDDFTILEALHYWTDILASGIQATDVKLLGINGGNIAAVEFRLALAFGAKVGIVEGSGRSADVILKDRDWNHSVNLIRLPGQAAAVRGLLGVHP
jgi:ppGpp synthetase/RelA/SpoT-type nucleotidyltranferase